MNEFDENEYRQLCRRFGQEAYVESASVECSSDSFYNRMMKLVMSDRRGEVVFCISRPDGRIIVTRSEGYPEGIFRIPSGGVRYGEDIVEALFREIMEELGLQVSLREFIGVKAIRFSRAGDSFMFYSYMFLLKETGGKLLFDARDDEISETREVDMDGFKKVVDSLSRIKGDWSDWGKFRHITSSAVFEYLKKGS